MRHGCLRALLCAAALSASLSACGRQTAPADRAIPENPAFNESEAVNGSTAAREAEPLSGAEQEPQQADPWAEAEGDPALVSLRSALIGTESVCAAAYLGYGEGKMREAMEGAIAGTPLSEDWSFLHLLPDEAFVDFEGDQLYCIVPRDDTASVAVNEWIINESNGYAGETGRVLYRSEAGHPIVLRCNVSDAMPNTEVVIVAADGAVLRWNPIQSLRDGSMMIPGIAPFVEDFSYALTRTCTPYEVPGDWTAEELYSSTGGLYHGTLSFGETEQRTVAWAFGPADRAYEVWYEGSWTFGTEEDGPGALVFDLARSGEEGKGAYPETLRGVFRIRKQPYGDGDWIELENLGGTSLTFDEKPGTVDAFVRSVG